MQSMLDETDPLRGVKASIAFVYLRKLNKIHQNAVRFRLFDRIVEQSIVFLLIFSASQSASIYIKRLICDSINYRNMNKGSVVTSHRGGDGSNLGGGREFFLFKEEGGKIQCKY